MKFNSKRILEQFYLLYFALKNVHTKKKKKKTGKNTLNGLDSFLLEIILFNLISKKVNLKD